MKQLKWINLLLICIIYFLACKKNDLHQNTTNTTNPNLYTVTLNGQDVQVLKKGDLYYFYDDVMFGQKTFDSLRQLYIENKTKPRSVYNPTASSQWRNGIVYYTISTAFNSYPTDRQKIIDAITHWEQNTSLQFVQRTNQVNYIGFELVSGESYAGASETIGMKGGYQYIKLDVADPFTRGTVIHEIGHALGLYHEQSRSDRDNSINVNWLNMHPDNETQYQFKTYVQNNLPGAEVGPFDFNSIMLYGSYAGSRFYDPSKSFDEQSQVFYDNPVMTRVVPNGEVFDAQRTSLSTGDIATIANIYGSPFARIYSTSDYWSSGGGTSEWERNEYTYMIEFFEDANCTIPHILTTSKIIRFTTSSGSDYNVILEPGFSSYQRGYGFYEYRAEYGNVVSTSSYYNIPKKVEGFWRARDTSYINYH